MVVPDSICYPKESDSIYPFNPDGTREFLEDKPFLEPFSLIRRSGGDRAAELRDVRPQTADPEPGAGGQAGDLDGGPDLHRLLLGVGTSPGPRTTRSSTSRGPAAAAGWTEEVDIIRGLSAGGWFEYHGEVFDIPAVKMSPVPTNPSPS